MFRFKKFHERKGWFKRAKRKWYNKRIVRWCCFSEGGRFGGSLKFRKEPSNWSYESGLSIDEEDYYLGDEYCFWKYRSKCINKAYGLHFYWYTKNKSDKEPRYHQI